MNDAVEVIENLAAEQGLMVSKVGMTSDGTSVYHTMCVWDAESGDPCSDNDPFCNHSIGSGCKRGIEQDGKFYRILMRIYIPDDGTLVSVLNREYKVHHKCELADPADYMALVDLMRWVKVNKYFDLSSDAVVVARINNGL